MSKRREATVAGLFYPGDEAALGAAVDAYLAAARPPTSRSRAIVSPHAGFDYSGDLAALAWASAAGGDYSRVVVVSPLHRAEAPLVYLPEADLFECPLGPVEVDREALSELRDCGTLFSQNDIPHFEEHGIELQLPFMRRLFPRARLVPVLLGKPWPSAVKALAAGLGLVFGRDAGTLVVVSADLAAHPDRELAASRSDRILELTLAGDWHGLLALESRGESGSCGAGCLAALLASSLVVGLEARLLGRHDSGRARELAVEAAPSEAAGEDWVGYAALGFAAAGA